MRKWVCIISGVMLVFYGCATSNALKTTAVSERNVNNLARLNLGMSESQVLCIMRDPYREEEFYSSADQYDVWFYITQPTVMSQTRMVPFNLTPLTFRNKVLVGMGYDYYRWLKNQFANQKEYRAPVEEKTESTIDESIENAFSMLAMSSSKTQEKESADPAPPEKKPTPKKTIEINEEDNQMIQDESDQNFNFW